MSISRKLLISFLSLTLAYTSVYALYLVISPREARHASSREDAKWIATSHSWTDRTACSWLGICGGDHWRAQTRWWSQHWRHRGGAKQNPMILSYSHEGDWYDPEARPWNWTKEERVIRDVPQYVLDYAPLVHLYSGEQFWPTDIADHLYHVTPKLNYATIKEHSINLTHLAGLNDVEKGRNVYLTSNDDPENPPRWLTGEGNIPRDSREKGSLREDARKDLESNGGAEGEIVDEAAKKQGWYEAGEGNKIPLGRRNAIPSVETDADAAMGMFDVEAYHEAIRARDTHHWRHRKAGKSNAPAVLVVVDKGDGVLDAFWFYFYSFNRGNKVLNIRFGNHVGDWEHSMVRFQHGEPKAIFLSEHNFGGAYSYDAIEKLGKRPVIYSATGSHAMYATPGKHTYVLPFGLLHDTTDRGPLWDPAANAHAYTYNYKTDTLLASTLTPYSPISWFYFAGHWGDKVYELGDERQYRFAGQYHYVNGPLGPRFKNLGRKKICQGKDTDPCVIKNWLEGAEKLKRRWAGPGIGEEWSEELEPRI